MPNQSFGHGFTPIHTDKAMKYSSVKIREIRGGAQPERRTAPAENRRRELSHQIFGHGFTPIHTDEAMKYSIREDP